MCQHCDVKDQGWDMKHMALPLLWGPQVTIVCPCGEQVSLDLSTWSWISQMCEGRKYFGISALAVYPPGIWAITELSSATERDVNPPPRKGSYWCLGMLSLLTVDLSLRVFVHHCYPVDGEGEDTPHCLALEHTMGMHQRLLAFN